MKISKADMPSYTYAMKGQKLLRSRGFPCDVKKRDTACGYSLHIYGDAAAAIEILDRYSIPYTLSETEVQYDKF